MIPLLNASPLYQDIVQTGWAKERISARLWGRLFLSLSCHSCTLFWVFNKVYPIQICPHPFHVLCLIGPLLGSLTIAPESGCKVQNFHQESPPACSYVYY